MRCCLVLVVTVGCFEHHVVSDSPPTDAARDVAVDASDAGFCFCATDTDCPAREECTEYVCEDCLCQPRRVPDCGFCTCVADEECPAPPPFGDCVRARCIDCACLIVADDSVCDDGRICDPATLLCIEVAEITIELRTNMRPQVDFDNVRVLSDVGGFDYRPARDDTFLMGVVIGSLSVPVGTELLFTTELSLRGEVLEVRDTFLNVERDVTISVVVTR